MSALDDLRARLMHHRSARKDLYDKRSDAIGLAVNGDLATATELADDIELAMHPALAAGSGSSGGPSTPVGCHVQTAFQAGYDGTEIAFDDTEGDVSGWWQAPQKRIETGESGLFIVSGYIQVVVDSGSITGLPDFGVEMSSLPWNFDPLAFTLTQRVGTSSWVGSASMPLVLDEGCRLKLLGSWNGDAVLNLSMCGLSVWKIAEAPASL